MKISFLDSIFYRSLIIFILIPWTVIEVGSFDIIKNGLAGIEGVHKNPLHPGVAFAMGIPMSIVLLTSPLCDQIFIQRIFAVKKEKITKSLIIGGLSFGIIPMALSMLGFIGVSLVQTGTIAVENPEMIGPEVIASILPHYALYLFTLMAFAGLCSTIDSALSASSSLGSVDVYKRYFKHKENDKRDVRVARIFMIVTLLFSLFIAFLQPNILWVFMIGGSVTASVFFPIIYSLYCKNIQALHIFLAVLLSLAIGLPYAIFANITNNTNHIVGASLLSVFLPLIILLLMKYFHIEKRTTTAK